MPQVSYETFMSTRQSSSNTNQRPRVGYFGLKADKQEALVRFMHDSPADLDIAVVHQYTQGNKRLKCNCLRTPAEPLEKCPFCAAKKPIMQRLYIHLIEYTKDDNGEVVATPKIWERSVAYVDTLRNLFEEYGPLCDNVFKVKRNGAPGSLDTTYDIMYANPTIYRPDVYIKDDEAFKGVKALGTVVMDKSADELQALLESEGGSEDQPVATQPKQATSAPAAQPDQRQTTNYYNSAELNVSNNMSSTPQPTESRTYVPTYGVDGTSTANQPVYDGEMSRPRRFY